MSKDRTKMEWDLEVIQKRKAIAAIVEEWNVKDRSYQAILVYMY